MAARKGTTSDYWFMDCECGFYCINTLGGQGRGQLKRFNLHKKRCTYVGPSKRINRAQVHKEIMNVKGGSIKNHHHITQSNNDEDEINTSLNSLGQGYYNENTQVFQGENHSTDIKTTRKQRRIQARAKKKRLKKEFQQRKKREKTKPVQKKEKEESDDEMITIDFIKKLSELGVECSVIIMS